MNTARHHLGVATLGVRIYAVGGSSGGSVLANGEVYDPQVMFHLYSNIEVFYLRN